MSGGVEGGDKASEVCRQMGVSEASFYAWKKKFSRMGRLPQLEEENNRLKKLVADLSVTNTSCRRCQKSSEARAAAGTGGMEPECFSDHQEPCVRDDADGAFLTRATHIRCWTLIPL